MTSGLANYHLRPTEISVHQVVSDSPIVKGKIVTLGIKAVDPQAHDLVLQNATAMKALTKGPYGETDVIGRMMSGGY
jgi:hypothetical protein